MPSSTRVPLALTLPWAVWAGVRTVGGERGWPLVPAMAFTRYAAGSSVLPLALALRARSRPAVAVSAAAAALLGAAVLRGAGPGPAAPEPGAPLRLASLNMLHGRADPAAVLALAAGVDVLALSEVTPEADAALRAAGLAGLLPHAHFLPSDEPAVPGAGGAVWTRLPVLARLQTPGHFQQPTLRVAPPGGPVVEVTAVHVHPPTSSADDVRRWHADLDRLSAPETGVLRVLAGDLNATPDHAAFRRVLGRGWTDAARATGQGLRPTWRPVRSPQPRLTLDHVLADPRITVAGLQVRPVPGTDHRALVADLRLPLDRAWA